MRVYIIRHGESETNKAKNGQDGLMFILRIKEKMMQRKPEIF